MSITILDALMNAELNINNARKMSTGQILPLEFAREQIRNSRLLLEKGYSPYQDVGTLFDKYGSIENIPDME